MGGGRHYELDLGTPVTVVVTVLFVAGWIVCVVCFFRLAFAFWQERRRLLGEQPYRPRPAVGSIALGNVALRHWVVAATFFGLAMTMLIGVFVLLAWGEPVK